MSRTIYLLGIISIAFSNIKPSMGDNFIVGLNDRLQLFGDCNIRVSKSLQDKFTTWDPITAPVELRKLLPNGSYKLSTKHSLPQWFTPLNKAMRGSMFKYRRTKYACEVDLIIHLSNEPLDRYSYDLSDWLVNTVEGFRLFLQIHSSYESQMRMQLKFSWIKQVNVAIPDTLSIFTWTLIQGASINGWSYCFQFFKIFYMTQLHGRFREPITAHEAESPYQSRNFQKELDIFRNMIEASRYIHQRPQQRQHKLPYDSQLTFDRKVYTDFYQFIKRLLYVDSTNTTIDIYQNLVTPKESHSRQQFTKVGLQYYVLDETEGFNFITCHTTDTFWSTALLFWKPYQHNVWLCIGACLLLTGSLALAKKMSTDEAFSPLKFLLFILFNLIEVSWNPGKMLKVSAIVFPCWLLMGVILTNSYKGLIISYLSAPWSPKQEWEYFHEMKGFQFYTSFAESNYLFWHLCQRFNMYNFNVSKSCYNYSVETTISSLKHAVKINSALGEEVSRSYSEVFGRVFVLPPNETERVNTALIGGLRVAIAGLNTEIDDILEQLTNESPRVTFFRGKEDLWSYMKYWMFENLYTRKWRKKLVNLMQSGIYQFWKYWLRDRKYIESKLKLLNPSPTPLSLGSNVFFVFVILIFGLVVATIGILIEKLFKRFETLGAKANSKLILPWLCQHSSKMTPTILVSVKLNQDPTAPGPAGDNNYSTSAKESTLDSSEHTVSSICENQILKRRSI